MRGRPDTDGYHQHLEIGNDIHTNTITSVSKDNLIIQTPIDLSLKNPQAVERANCISARQDRGISNRSKEGTGVLMNSIKFVIGGYLMTCDATNYARENYHLIEYAHTIEARDYKGAGRQVFNVIVEVKNE